MLCFDKEEERMRWMSLGGNVFFLVMCASSWVFPPGLSSWVEEVVSPARESPGGRDDNWLERKSAIEMSCRLSWRRSLLLRELPGGVLENRSLGGLPDCQGPGGGRAAVPESFLPRMVVLAEGESLLQSCLSSRESCSHWCLGRRGGRRTSEAWASMRAGSVSML